MFAKCNAWDDKDVQERIVRGSKLDWVIVRPVILTNGPKTNAYRALVDPRGWTCGFIRRAAAIGIRVTSISRIGQRGCSRLRGCESRRCLLGKPVREHQCFGAAVSTGIEQGKRAKHAFVLLSPDVVALTLTVIRRPIFPCPSQQRILGRSSATLLFK